MNARQRRRLRRGWSRDLGHDVTQEEAFDLLYDARLTRKWARRHRLEMSREVACTLPPYGRYLMCRSCTRAQDCSDRVHHQTRE